MELFVTLLNPFLVQRRRIGWIVISSSSSSSVVERGQLSCLLQSFLGWQIVLHLKGSQSRSLVAHFAFPRSKPRRWWSLRQQLQRLVGIVERFGVSFQVEKGSRSVAERTQMKRDLRCSDYRNGCRIGVNGLRIVLIDGIGIRQTQGSCGSHVLQLLLLSSSSSSGSFFHIVRPSSLSWYN